MLQWIFVSLMIALLMLTFAVSPLQKSVDEVARNNEKVVMQELATAINLAQTSQDETSYKLLVPSGGNRDTCKIDVRNGIIKLSFSDNGVEESIFANYVVTPIAVRTEQESENCRTGALLVERNADAVTIKAVGA